MQYFLVGLLAGALLSGLVVGALSEPIQLLPRSWRALLACAALFVGFGCYLLTVRRRRGVVPCGCLGDTGRTSQAAVLRALVLAGLCGAYALQPHLPAFSPTARAGIVCAAVLLTGVAVVLERLSAVLRPVAVTSG